MQNRTPDSSRPDPTFAGPRSCLKKKKKKKTTNENTRKTTTEAILEANHISLSRKPDARHAKISSGLSAKRMKPKTALKPRQARGKPTKEKRRREEEEEESDNNVTIVSGNNALIMPG